MKNRSAFTIWLTGLSGAGKSTLAVEIKKHFDETNIASCILDGDTLRSGLSKDLKFDAVSRAESVRRAAEFSKILNANNIISIVPMISPLEEQRNIAKSIISANSFFEVYVSTPLPICESRDTKGLYKKARSREINDFTGISSAYDIPKNADIEINTHQIAIDQSVKLLIDAVKQRYF